MQKHLFILIASACLVLAACTSKEPAGRGGAGVPAIPVTTALVEPMQWVDTIEAEGTTRVRESITLTAKISDTVRKVLLVRADIHRFRQLDDLQFLAVCCPGDCNAS